MLGNFTDIISRLESQKATIDKALAALREFEGDAPVTAETPKQRGRPAKSVEAPIKKKRVLSEEGKKRIAAAAKKRWAAFHRTAKKAA